MKKNLVIALVAVLAMSAGAAAAETTYEVKQGTVLHVDGNHLFVKMTDGTVRDAEVPPDFMFDVNGKMVPVTALKPGTMLTQTITTVTTPEVVKSTEIREAEIVQRKGQTVIYRDGETGKLNMITGIPEGWIVYRDGKQVPVEALAGGDKVTAYIVHKETKMVTEEEMRVAGFEPPKPAPAPKAAPAPVRKPAPAPMLPKTGSNLPLAGLTGLLALALGLGIAVIRR